MLHATLRDFLDLLESRDQLKRISIPVDPRLEVTEIASRVLKAQGPALLFEKPLGSQFPLLANLFGSLERVALGMGREDISHLREVGELLAFLRHPDPPQNMRDAWRKLPIFRQVMSMAPRLITRAPFDENCLEGSDVDLDLFPLQTCWPEDAAPLVTWPLVITRGPNKPRQNLGIYRMQLLEPNKLIVRWLAHRGGALDYREWCKTAGKAPFPVAVALGADPATTLAAVTPVPDTLSEHAFAGLLRGRRSELLECTGSLQVPASAEIILEGYLDGATAVEGPFGDHTGYYNEIEPFPVFTVERIRFRDRAIYHSTYTGRPPDEPSILGVALNEVFIPILQRQFPEIIDFYLPPEGCSYRVAVITIRKEYAGHAKRVMMAAWSFLRQFMYTKFLIVTDDDINARDWRDVVWAISTRVDPVRDTLLMDNTPIDYLDFASPKSGLGGKMGLDATNKLPGETDRDWGKPIRMSNEIKARVDSIWNDLGLS